MKANLVQNFLIGLFLLLLIFSIHVPGQTFQPDQQIVAEMTAYARKVENDAVLTRPRLVYKPASVPVSFAQNDSLKPFKILDNETGLGKIKTLALEHQAFEILNDERLKNGLNALEWNDELARIARLHSENMARFKFFSHAGLDGSMVNNRADALGVSNWQSIGENIVYNRGFKKPVESACQQWMNSPSHRQNILNKKWKASGIGAAIAPDGTYYFTQVFILS